MNILWDENRCTKCSRCIQDCPLNAISFKKKKITISDECCFCMACVKLCPENAFLIKDMNLSNHGIICDCCPIGCTIKEGRTGACKRYTNREGKLIRLTPLLEYRDVREVVGEVDVDETIKRPLITGIGAGTTYPDLRPAPYIVKGRVKEVDVVTVVTEAPLSYSSILLKIDTDINIGEEGSAILRKNRKVGMVITEQYGSKMLSIGGVNLLTSSDGLVVARTISDIVNRKEITLRVKNGALLKIKLGTPPIIDGIKVQKMRVGCGSATLGMFSKLISETIDEAIIVDPHITGLMSEHPAGRYLGLRPSGIKLKLPMSTPGRYFGNLEDIEWNILKSKNPLDIIKEVDMERAAPGMRLLITDTTAERAFLFQLQEDGRFKKIPLTDKIKKVLKVIRDTCEESTVSAIYMGGAGGSARAGVVKYPKKLTEAVHNKRANLTVGGAPVFIMPGGGINFLVDISRVKRGAFYWTPTPAIICPIEYTMKVEDYEAIGGHVEIMKPFRVNDPLLVLD